MEGAEEEAEEYTEVDLEEDQRDQYLARVSLEKCMEKCYRIWGKKKTL